MSDTTPLPQALHNAREKKRKRSLDYYYAHKHGRPTTPPAFDPDLVRPVHVAPTPAPPMLSAAERWQLKQELGCLNRELATTQRAIDHLLTQLAA